MVQKEQGATKEERGAVNFLSQKYYMKSEEFRTTEEASFFWFKRTNTPKMTVGDAYDLVILGKATMAAAKKAGMDTKIADHEIYKRALEIVHDNGLGNVVGKRGDEYGLAVLKGKDVEAPTYSAYIAAEKSAAGRKQIELEESGWGGPIKRKAEEVKDVPTMVVMDNETGRSKRIWKATLIEELENGVRCMGVTTKGENVEFSVGTQVLRYPSAYDADGKLVKSMTVMDFLNLEKGREYEISELL